MAETAWPTETDLEKLFVNNPDLDRLEAYLNRFNPIRIMRMEDMEIRHSNIIGWLLDPLENHGLGDRFLKSFLAEAMKNGNKEARPSSLDIIQADLRDVEVYREWQSIDLLLLSRLNNWVFIIENKFHSTQHGKQLARYVDKVRNAFEHEEGQLNIKGIFLTLHEEEPEDPSYASIGYNAICELLPRILETEGQAVGQQVRIFIEHYIEIIREAASMSDEQNQMEELARALYRQHSKVLDFVLKYGSSTDFLRARDMVFGDDWAEEKVLSVGDEKFVSLGSSGSRFSFLPQSWYTALGKEKDLWNGCENWWSGFPLICWMTLVQNSQGVGGAVRLYAEVGPLKNFELRQELISAIKKIAEEKNLDKIQFKNAAYAEKAQYSRFLTQNTISIKDVQEIEEVSSAILKLLNRFQPHFKAISTILNEFTITATSNTIPRQPG